MQMLHLYLHASLFLTSKPTLQATLARPVRPMPQPQRPTARCVNWRCFAHRRRRQRPMRPMGQPRSRAAKVSPTKMNLARQCCRYCRRHWEGEETRTWLCVYLYLCRRRLFRCDLSINLCKESFRATEDTKILFTRRIFDLFVAEGKATNQWTSDGEDG